jgi:hypothetical protein
MKINFVHVTNYVILLFLSTADGFLPSDSGTAVIHNTQYTLMQHMKLYKQ